MRSTLILDDELAKRAKKRAADERTTLSAIVNQALRELLSKRPAAKRQPYQPITFGSGAPVRHREPSELWRILEQDEGA